jgi:adenine-specific DNA-methyltransferase
MPDNNDLKKSIQAALINFENNPLADSARALLQVLGYQSDKTLPIKPNTADTFQAMFDPRKVMKAEAKLDEWKSVDLLFQVTSDEISMALKQQEGMFVNKKIDKVLIESYLFFAIELTCKTYSRTDLANITRELNKCFKMPALIIFKHGETLTFSIIARRINMRDETKDVLRKVTLLKDIRFIHTHAAHRNILEDLALPELAKKNTINTFVDLQTAWEKVLDINELNKKFYKEIANWYFWAVKTVKFPSPLPTSPKIQSADFRGGDEAERNAQNVIRLITRLIFVWFIKEKELVPEDLFDAGWLKDNLDFSDAKKSTYYKAILQNLFFATLNTPMGDEREFRRENAKGQDPDYLMSNFYRYKRYFKKPDAALELFARIPFLNGGLFECLDKEIEKGNVIRVDGFSDRDDNPLTVPDDLFLMEKEKEIDLNEIYDTKNKKYKVRGLIHIFNSYKFTIEENTPIEEEIALDPELLGKVFENLLAAYNPETGTTARKQTGSFYTPREIVNYMVDEALVAYLESAVSLRDGALPSKQSPTASEEIASQSALAMTERLRDLLSYNPNPPAFSDAEKSRLIAAVDNVKVLDPAAGSGAFPMGVLHKLVFLLAKLDPKNEGWKKRQLDKAYEMSSSEAREASIKSTEDVFENNHDDYGRKLYLIENCIYGVDIQPIAVQIAKLRFFISLVVDQKSNAKKPNLGIRPLPNLETKFVAANTLIGINRPDTKPADDKPVSRDPEIESRFKLLIAAFEQFIQARNPAVKAKWMDSGKQAAAEINAALKNDPSFQPLNVEWIFETQTLEALKAQLNIKEAKASPMVLRNQQIEEKEKELERVRREHFSARTPATKRKYRDLDKKLRLEIADLLSENHALADEAAQQLAGWDPYNQNAHADFFDPEWMFGIEGGFDVVIGNPPYVRQEQISELKPTLQKQYSCYTGTADLYVYFYERGIQALRENGVLVYISSNKYFRSGYGEKLRGFLGRQTTIRNLIDFGDAPIFTAIAYPSIIVTQKKVVTENHIRALVWQLNDPLDEFEEIRNTRSFSISQGFGA